MEIRDACRKLENAETSLNIGRELAATRDSNPDMLIQRLPAYHSPEFPGGDECPGNLLLLSPGFF